MKSLVRVLLFILAFNVNVSLKARAEMLEYPKDCLASKNEECVVKSISSAGVLSTASVNIELSAESTVILRGESYRLVNGVFYVRALSSVVVDVKFGKAKLNSGDMVLFKLDEGRATLSVMSGEVTYILLNNEKHVLPAGYANWIGAPSELGVVRSGIPSSIDFPQLILDLNAVSQLSKDEMYITLKTLKPFWELAHSETESRYLASIQETLKREEEVRLQKEREKQRQEKERKKWRELFFQKTFLE